MAGNPETVVAFLDSLAQKILPKAREELDLLRSCKRKEEGPYLLQ
jgi:Zn-dependent oligopeptidase